MLTRRHVLEVLAAAPALGACASNQPDPAAAWRSPGAGEADPRRFALAHAILAPNPHNMQPWLITLEGDDAIALHIDRTRLLPVTDPPNRQITVGCGAFLELLAIAARENGWRADITPFPEGEPQPTLDERPVARIVLAKDATLAKDPHYAQIVARRTNRTPYDPARIPGADALAAVTQAIAPGAVRAASSNDPAAVAKLRDLAFRGWSREMATPAAVRETVAVMRIGAAELAAHRDGLVLDGPAIEVMHAVGIVNRRTLLDPKSEANKQGAAMWKKLADTAPAFVWLTGADNTRATQIASGRAYARMNLAAAAQGLAMHPWSMALEEYPEMAELYAEQQALLGATAAAPVQMLARIGYARPVKPAPRRSLAEFMHA